MARRAVAVAPGHAGLRSNHGNVLQTLGRLDEAEREYRAALAAEPALVAAWNNLGVQYMWQAETATAEPPDEPPAICSSIQGLRATP